MFGWYGVFIFSFLLGNILKRIWLWVNLDKEEPLALLVFILNITYIFMIITRVYLPQQLNLYLFTVAPIFMIYILNCKKVYYPK